MTRPAQRLQVTVVICAAMYFGFDMVNSGCGYRLAILQALLADMPITLQDTRADNVPLTAVSSLVSVLPALMLLPAFVGMVIAVP